MSGPSVPLLASALMHLICCNPTGGTTLLRAARYAEQALRSEQREAGCPPKPWRRRAALRTSRRYCSSDQLIVVAHEPRRRALDHPAAAGD